MGKCHAKNSIKNLSTNKHSTVYKSLFILLLITSFPSFSRMYRARYQDHIPMFELAIMKALLTNNVCNDRNDCVKKQIFFWEPESDGLYVNFYSLEDQKVAYGIINSLFTTYLNESMKITIVVSIYAGTHSVVREGLRNIFKTTKPTISLIINGED